MKGGWFITGTDTGVGKTLVSEAMLRAIGRTGRRAAGMKPVASGCRRTSAGLKSEDAERLQAAASVPTGDYTRVNPYAFEPPVAPALAAAAVDAEIQPEVIERHFRTLTGLADWVIVEGIGGWRVPISAKRNMSDVACALALPVVLVVGGRLGCINHALLTADAIRADGCDLAGWVVNHIDPAYDVTEPTLQLLRERIDAPMLASIPHRPPADAWCGYGATILARLLS